MPTQCLTAQQQRLARSSLEHPVRRRAIMDTSRLTHPNTSATGPVRMSPRTHAVMFSSCEPTATHSCSCGDKCHFCYRVTSHSCSSLHGSTPDKRTVASLGATSLLGGGSQNMPRVHSSCCMSPNHSNPCRCVTWCMACRLNTQRSKERCMVSQPSCGNCVLVRPRTRHARGHAPRPLQHNGAPCVPSVLAKMGRRALPPHIWDM